MRYAVFMEARNQSLRTQRAVVDVIAARVRKTGKGVCKVLGIRGQFPWARKGFAKTLDKSFVEAYDSVVVMKPVFEQDSGYVYFNHVKHPWGNDTKRIGDLYFSR